MTEVDVLIPHRTDHTPWRDINLTWTTRQWSRHFPDWGIIVGTHTHGRWDKAAAIADALRASTAHTLVIADNDVWVHQSDDTVRAVHGASVQGWAIPHHKVHRLDESSSATYRRDPGTPPEALTHTRRPYTGVPGGGIIVIDRDVYTANGGFDPRFLGHTGQDRSFGYLLRTLVGPPWRGDSPLVHLHHQPSPDLTDAPLQHTNRILMRRYHRATGKKSDMEKIRDQVCRIAPDFG